MNDPFFVLWIFLPAGVANVTPIFIAHTPYFKNYNFPLDFHRTYQGKRLLGDGKTVRGFLFGIFCAIIVAYLQFVLYRSSASLHNLLPGSYAMIAPLTWGVLSGFGALLGDSVKSFFKRQIGVPRGGSWIPFDQLDYVLGFIVCTYFYFALSLYEYALLLVVWFLIHVLSTHIGYWSKLKKSPL